MRREGAKARLKEFFLLHVGEVVTSHQLKEVAGSTVTEWARRVRELRELEGWKILTHHDLAQLKSGEYVLAEQPPSTKKVTFSRGISTRLRAEVLDRNGFTCQMCGATPGEVDPVSWRPVRLHVGHIVDRSIGGVDELSNLRALCSTCNQGAKNVTGEKPSAIWLLSQIRRGGIDEQKAVYDWLKRKFEDS